MPAPTKDKSLKEKAIKIKGKDYVLVADRIKYFNEEYPSGSIRSELISYEDKQIVMRAIILPNAQETGRAFVAYSQEVEGVGMVNKTSALENAETSAVGRALGMMGIGVIESVASVDEMNKAGNRAVQTPPADPKTGEIQSLGNCEKCGAPLKVSKAGKKYCSAICWGKKTAPPPEAPARKITEEELHENLDFDATDQS